MAVPKAEEVVARLRRTVEMLTGIANLIERGVPDEREQAWLVRTMDAALRRLVGLDHADPKAISNIYRDNFLGSCAAYGAGIHGAKGDKMALVESQADEAIKVFLGDAPEYADRLRAVRPDVVGLMRTYAVPVGGRRKQGSVGRSGLRTRICEALGWNPNTDANRQSKSRKKKLVTG